MSSYVFNLALPVRTKIVYSQAVLFFVNYFNKSIFQNTPLGRIDFTFEYGFLRAVPVVLTCFCDLI